MQPGHFDLLQSPVGRGQLPRQMQRFAGWLGRVLGMVHLQVPPEGLLIRQWIDEDIDRGPEARGQLPGFQFHLFRGVEEGIPFRIDWANPNQPPLSQKEPGQRLVAGIGDPAPKHQYWLVVPSVQRQHMETQHKRAGRQ